MIVPLFFGCSKPQTAKTNNKGGLNGYKSPLKFVWDDQTHLVLILFSDRPSSIADGVFTQILSRRLPPTALIVASSALSAFLDSVRVLSYLCGLGSSTPALRSKCEGKLAVRAGLMGLS